ncbi:MAG: sugar phosphate isomerase/epimerase family protein [Sphingobacteriaceae bacterium]
MSEISLTRRQALKAFSATAGISILSTSVSALDLAKSPQSGFKYSLNMSTIKGQELGFIKELEVASKAGFRSVEIWMDTLQTYLDKGGSLTDAKKRISDLGLTIENAIGFAKWIVDDEKTRNEGLQQLRREMDMLAKLGCFRTAAPPMGATDTAPMNLNTIAERYRTILEIGDQSGVRPQLELWGFSNNLNRISDVLYIAAQAEHPASRILLDVYHIYKGNSSVNSLPMVGKAGMEVFHVNDYPANLPPKEINDSDRIYVGDGVAPIRQILQTVKKIDKPLIISFEVFNKSYYAQDALLVAKTALEKMKALTQGIA